MFELRDPRRSTQRRADPQAVALPDGLQVAGAEGLGGGRDVPGPAFKPPAQTGWAEPCPPDEPEEKKRSDDRPKDREYLNHRRSRAFGPSGLRRLRQLMPRPADRAIFDPIPNLRSTGRLDNRRKRRLESGGLVGDLLLLDSFAPKLVNGRSKECRDAAPHSLGDPSQS